MHLIHNCLGIAVRAVESRSSALRLDSQSAPLPKLCKASGTLNDVRELVELKAEPPIEVTPVADMSAAVSEEQPRNALLPIDLKLAGNETVTRAVQSR